MCRLQCVKAQAEPTHHLIRQLNQFTGGWSIAGAEHKMRHWAVWVYAGGTGRFGMSRKFLSSVSRTGITAVRGCSYSSAECSLALNTAGPGELSSSRGAHQSVTPGSAFQGIWEPVRLRPRPTISQWTCLVHLGNGIRACCIKVVL